MKCDSVTGIWPIAGFMVSQHGGSAFARWYPQTLSGPEHHWLTNTINTVTCYLYNGYIRGTKYVEIFFKRSSHVNIDSQRHQPMQGIFILCFLVSFVLTPSVYGWRWLSSIFIWLPPIESKSPLRPCIACCVGSAFWLSSCADTQTEHRIPSNLTAAISTSTLLLVSFLPVLRGTNYDKWIQMDASWLSCVLAQLHNTSENSNDKQQ